MDPGSKAYRDDELLWFKFFGSTLAVKYFHILKLLIHGKL